MSDGSLRYEIAFDVKGLGETARVTRTIKDVEAAARSVRTQRITDLGLAAQAARAGEATRGVNGLSQALASVARVAGAGPLAEFGNNLANVAERSGQAGGALGSLLRIAGGVGVAVTGFRMVTEYISKMNEELDAAIANTNRLSRSGNDALAGNSRALGAVTNTEERDAFLADLEAQRTKLVRQMADSTDTREKAQLSAQRQQLDTLATNAGALDLKTRAQQEAFQRDQENEARKRELAPAFAVDQANARKRERFELSLSETPDTLGGAQKRRQILLDQSNTLSSERSQAAAALNAATRTGTASELEAAQRVLAGVLAEEADIRLSLVRENKTIADLTAKEAEAKAKAQADVRKEAQQGLKSASANVSRRLGEGPAVDSFARSGLFVGGGNAGAESLRWQQASANALGRILGIMQRQATANPAGFAATWAGG